MSNPPSAKRYKVTLTSRYSEKTADIFLNAKQFKEYQDCRETGDPFPLSSGTIRAAERRAELISGDYFVGVFAP